jgi:hypothetical protein
MKDDIVLLAVYQNPHTAHVMRTRLESDGISAWVTDEQSIMNTSFFSDTLGGAKLYVQKKDEFKARETIEEIE